MTPTDPPEQPELVPGVVRAWTPPLDDHEVARIRAESLAADVAIRLDDLNLAAVDPAERALIETAYRAAVEADRLADVKRAEWEAHLASGDWLDIDTTPSPNLPPRSRAKPRRRKPLPDPNPSIEAGDEWWHAPTFDAASLGPDAATVARRMAEGFTDVTYGRTPEPNKRTPPGSECTGEQARERLGMTPEIFAVAYSCFYARLVELAVPGPNGKPVKVAEAADRYMPYWHYSGAEPSAAFNFGPSIPVPPTLAVLRDTVGAWHILALEGPTLTTLVRHLSRARSALHAAARPTRTTLKSEPPLAEAEAYLGARAAVLAALRALLPAPVEDARRRPLPTVADAFHNGVGTITSPLAVQATLSSFHAAATDGAPGWQLDANGRPAFGFRQPQGRAVVTLQSPDSGELAERLWDKVKRLDDLASDVLLAALAQWCGHRDANGGVWLTADAILDYRGVKRKTKRDGIARYSAGHRAEDREDIAARFEVLDSMFIDVDQFELEDRQRRGKPPARRRVVHQSKLVSVSDRIAQTEITGGSCPVAWHYRPGTWADHFLEGPNRQFAQLMQQSLRYDPYREKWEKRLALYFALHLRISRHKSAALTRKVGKMLAELCLTPDRRNPQKTPKRLAMALDRLRDDGVIGGWEGPPDPSTLPAKGWLDLWLAATLTVWPPPAMLESGTEPAIEAQRDPLHRITSG